MSDYRFEEPDTELALQLRDPEVAAIAELARRTKLPTERLVIGGRSMGGRYCSLVAGDPEDPVPVLGLVLLGYPLHAAGKPEKERSEHGASSGGRRSRSLAGST